jgi:hypothetical protein
VKYEHKSTAISNIQHRRLSKEAHTCDPTYLEGRDRRITVRDHPGQKKKKGLSRLYLKEQAGDGGAHLKSELPGQCK